MENKNRKKITPIIITVVVILFSLAYIATFICLAFNDILALPVALIAIVIYLIVCVGIIAALRERIKEIDGGLEDATFKY
ncbi:MAG: hypothetical protein J6A67_08980 [Clostridia bacterium]|nr:hypothetical protein [Clostridia bacterium]